MPQDPGPCWNSSSFGQPFRRSLGSPGASAHQFSTRSYPAQRLHPTDARGMRVSRRPSIGRVRGKRHGVLPLLQGEVPRPMEMSLGPWWMVSSTLALAGRADEHSHTLEELEVLPTRLTTEDSMIRGYARILHGTWKEALERASDLR